MGGARQARIIAHEADVKPVRAQSPKRALACVEPILGQVIALGQLPKILGKLEYCSPILATTIEYKPCQLYP